MNRLWLLITLSAFQIGFAQEKIPFIDYDSVIERASTRNAEGDIKGLISELNTINKNDSTYYSVLLKRSFYHLQLEEYDRAIALCDEGLSSNNLEEKSSFLVNKVASYSGNEQYEVALEIIEDGLKEFPTNRKLWYNKGYIYESMGETEEAINIYQKLILLHPYYKTPHLRLGNLAYKQHKMAQALMCFNMYIMLEPDADDAPSLLNQLNRLQTAKNKNEISGDITISKDDSAFEEIDLILSQRVAISDSYDTGNEIDNALMKQNHALFTTLANFESAGGFWSNKYVPFFQWVMNEEHFNDFTYTLTYAIEDEQYQNTIGKKTDEIVAFLDLAKNKWAEILKKNVVKKDNREIELTNYYENERIRAVGQEVNDKLVGDWKFYNEKGQITTDGNFDSEGKRHGKWVWYYNHDTIKETAIYNHGVLEGPYLTFFKNGEKQIVAKYKNDKLEGEYRAYFEQGGLSEKKILKKGKLNGVLLSYFSLGEDYLEYHVPYKEGVVEGIVKEYHINGELYEETPYVNDKIQGIVKQYNSQGVLLKEVQYLEGKLDGINKSYYVDGKPYEIGQCLDGEYEGAWKSYNPNGTLSGEFNYEKGKLQGIRKFYDEDGKLHLEYTYRKGEIIAYKIFDKKGTLLNEAKKKGGEFLYKSFNGYGNLLSNGRYDIKGGKMGIWKFYDDNGHIKSEGNYQENELEGTYINYFNNGTIQSKSEYKNGLLEGYFVDNYKNGAMRTQGWYKNNEASGEWRSYFKDGTLLAVNFYHKGNYHGEQLYYAVDGSKSYTYNYSFGTLLNELIYKPDGTLFESVDYSDAVAIGKWKYHHYNGKIKSEASYKNGVKHGPYIAYDYYGNKTVSGDYLGGSQHGTWTWFYDKGNIKSTADFHIDQYHGKSLSYYENGTLEDAYEYNFGNEEGTWNTYFDDGTLMIKTHRESGKYNGRVEFYSPKGKLQIIEFYVYDRLIGYSYHDKDGNEISMIPIENETGKLVSYYDNGQVAREYEYINENLHGKAITYHYNGSYQNIRNFIDDNRNGTSSYYYPNGTLKKVTDYLQGVKHGKEILYHKNKKVKEESHYLNGTKHGTSQHFDEQGELIKKERYFNGDVYE